MTLINKLQEALVQEEHEEAYHKMFDFLNKASDVYAKFMEMGMDQKDILNQMRDMIAAKWKIDRKAAANIVRLVVHITSGKVGVQSPYSSDDVKQIIGLAFPGKKG